MTKGIWRSLPKQGFLWHNLLPILRGWLDMPKDCNKGVTGWKYLRASFSKWKRSIEGPRFVFKQQPKHGHLRKSDEFNPEYVNVDEIFRIIEPIILDLSSFRRFLVLNALEASWQLLLTLETVRPIYYRGRGQYLRYFGSLYEPSCGTLLLSSLCENQVYAFVEVRVWNCQICCCFWFFPSCDNCRPRNISTERKY